MEFIKINGLLARSEQKSQLYAKVYVLAWSRYVYFCIDVNPWLGTCE